MIDQTRLLEELSLNAWPALRQTLFDGWVLRLSNGHTRRANSVNPLYPGHLSPLDKIAYCERLYQSHHLPTVFKITPATEPHNLDDLLASRGYALEAPTTVLTLDLPAFFSTNPAAPDSPTIHTTPHLTDAWLSTLLTFSPNLSPHADTLKQMLSSITPQARFAIAYHHNTPVSLGLAVLDHHHLGLFDLLTHPDHRRQGHARRLLLSLLSCAHAHHAHTAYLQVTLDNHPARSLYANLGFREHHRYHYRVRHI